MRKYILIAWMVLAGALFGSGAHPALQIDAAFDSGSIGAYSIDEANSIINFALKTETLLNTSDTYTYWTNFKVLDALNRTVTFRITNASAVPFLSTSGREAQLVYSCDGENWNRIANHSYSGGTYTFSQNFTCYEPQVATFYPFSYTRMRDFVNTVSASEWVGKTVLGSSEQGRDIELLTITNPDIPAEDKRVIYIVGRQHAAETSSSHMLEGLIDLLISEDPDACGLRNHYLWYIVPMVNPDGVYLGNSRATSELRDPNRDWDNGNQNSVEINVVRAHANSVNAGPGIDMFIDWHSQMDDSRWYNFTYAPSGNTFFPILSDWTDFDSQNTSGTSCSQTLCSSRAYATLRMGVPIFVFEPTPHLVSWSEAALRRQGVNFAFAVNNHFGLFEGALLADSGFGTAADSTALRTQGPGRGWYESRNDNPGLLSLDQSDVGGNSGKKAKLSASATANAYLTQRLGQAQDGRYAVRWQIYVDSILDNANFDRGALMLIGDGGGTSEGPNSTGTERFVYMAFHRPGGGGDSPADTMSLIASEPGDPFDNSAGWLPIASGLAFDTWHTITVLCNLNIDTYDVYLDDDGEPRATVSAFTPKASLTHISFAQMAQGAGTFYVDNVEDATLPMYGLELGRTDCSGRCLGDTNGDHDVDGSDLAALIASLAAQAPCADY